MTSWILSRRPAWSGPKAIFMSLLYPVGCIRISCFRLERINALDAAARGWARSGYGPIDGPLIAGAGGYGEADAAPAAGARRLRDGLQKGGLRGASGGSDRVGQQR